MIIYHVDNDIHMRWHCMLYALHCTGERLCQCGANLKINRVGVDLIGCRSGTSLITSHQILGQRYLNLRAHVGDALCIDIIYRWYYLLLNIHGV